MNKFHLDIITPTSIKSFNDVSYLRIPGLDGLTGILAKHADTIIAIDVGEIKITINGKNKYYSTSGGYSDIHSSNVQLLLETVEEKNDIDKKRAEKSLERAQKIILDKKTDLDRAQRAIKKAKNRLKIFNK